MEIVLSNPTGDEANKYITPTRLEAERGWSKSKIKQVLGEPDKTFAINGSRTRAYGTGSLYLMERVLEAERIHGDEIKKSRSRRDASLRVASQKRDEVLKWVESLDIQFSNAPKTIKRLAQKAIENRNDVGAFYPDGKERSLEHATYTEGCWNEVSVRRWMQNYLRHVCTDYESQLNDLYRKTGHDEAYVRLRERINKAADAYISLLAVGQSSRDALLEG